MIMESQYQTGFIMEIKSEVWPSYQIKPITKKNIKTKLNRKNRVYMVYQEGSYNYSPFRCVLLVQYWGGHNKYNGSLILTW